MDHGGTKGVVHLDFSQADTVQSLLTTEDTASLQVIPDNMQEHRLQFRGTWTSWRNGTDRNLTRAKANTKSSICERIAPGSNKGWGSSMWKNLAEKDRGILMDNVLNENFAAVSLCSKEGQLNCVGKNWFCLCKPKCLPPFALVRLHLV